MYLAGCLYNSYRVVRRTEDTLGILAAVATLVSSSAAELVGRRRAPHLTGL
jgi:hypothetical protein